MRPPWLVAGAGDGRPGRHLRLMDSIEEPGREGRPQERLAEALRRTGHHPRRRAQRPGSRRRPTHRPPDVVYASLARRARCACGRRAVRGRRRTPGRSRSSRLRPVTRTHASPSGLGRPGRWSRADRRWSPTSGPRACLADQATVMLATRTADEARHRDRQQPADRAHLRSGARGALRGDDRATTVPGGPTGARLHRGRTCPTGRTIAEYDGAAERPCLELRGGTPTSSGPVRPEEHPYAAFDGSFFTAWATAPLVAPVGPVDRGPVRRAPRPGRWRWPSTPSTAPTSRSVRRRRPTTRSVVADVEADGSVPDIELPDDPTTPVADHGAGSRGRGTDQVRLRRRHASPATTSGAA